MFHLILLSYSRQQEQQISFSVQCASVEQTVKEILGPKTVATCMRFTECKILTKLGAVNILIHKRLYN